jgi:hypothetical protein
MLLDTTGRFELYGYSFSNSCIGISGVRSHFTHASRLFISQVVHIHVSLNEHLYAYTNCFTQGPNLSQGPLGYMSTMLSSIFVGRGLEDRGGM